MRVKASTELAKKQRKSVSENTQATTNNITNSTTNEVDESDETTAAIHANKTQSGNKQCVHVNKSINNLNVLKRMIKQQQGNCSQLAECTSCCEAKLKSTEFKASRDTTLWVCLYCAHLGCDRHNDNQHALKHYQTPRSVVHCVCLNLMTWSLWCYECDDEIVNCSKRIDEIVCAVRKMVATASALQHQTGVECSTSGSCEVIHVARPVIVAIPKPIVLNTQSSIVTTQTLQNRKPTASATTSVSQQQQQQRAVGLSNLGNTCFFNAVLQNLAQTPNFESLLLENISNRDKQEVLQLTHETDFESCTNGTDSSDSEDSRKVAAVVAQKGHHQQKSTKTPDQLVININEPGALSQSMYSLIRDMNSCRSSIISPGSLFIHVCKKVPSFKGYQQQDSHELLRHLLDAIKAEEIKRRQCGILSALNINKSAIDDSLRQKVKLYGRTASFTFIDSLFGGSLLSSVLCEQCKMCSQNIEPFLDLSLPIVDEKTVHNSQAASISMSNSKQPIIADDLRDSQSYVSKHQIKKQKQLAKKTKKKKPTKSAKNGDDTKPDDSTKDNEDDNDDLDDNDVDDEREPLGGSEQAGPQQQGNTDQIDSSALQLHSLELALHEATQPNDAALNEFKLEAMQSVSQRRLNSLLSQNDEQQNSCNLQSCLFKFTSPEILSGTNKFGCENCTRISSRANRQLSGQQQQQQQQAKTVYTQAIKQYLICELPAVLTIHLKRFQQHGYRLEKVNKHVNFPLQLDMSPYTSRHCTNLTQQSVHNSTQYSLYGLVEHSGRLNGGHYTAYIKLRKKQNLDRFLVRKKLNTLKPYVSSGQIDSCSDLVDGACDATATAHTAASGDDTSPYTWYYISDSQVTEVSESRILKLQAYILFYERILVS